MTQSDAHALDTREIRQLRRLGRSVRRARYLLLGATALLTVALILRCLAFWLPSMAWTAAPLIVALALYLGASGWFWWLIERVQRRFERATRTDDP